MGRHYYPLLGVTTDKPIPADNYEGDLFEGDNDHMSLIDQMRASTPRATPSATPTSPGSGDMSGFRRADTIASPRRLIVSVEALEKQGKTHFALTAPGEIAYHNFDVGLEGVIEKFDTSRIHVADYPRPKMAYVAGGETAIAEAAEQVWGKFVRDQEGALAAPTIRTLVWDTATENYEVLRLARFGKLTQVMPHHYGPVNSEYREQLRKVYDTDKNLILLHKLGAEWENYTDATGREKGRKTGRYERKGFNDIGFAVQVIVRSYRDYDQPGAPFCLTVLDCRQNPAIIGETLQGELCAFPYLAMLVYPGTSLEDWQ